ncbi:MAG: 2-hydroxyacyl-CoA dehydratase, partial [Lachnospiraceae bacterium]|nr:2-hydroxyacyl-CoA dehydratase [Lachnospiraceae bacterium]
AQYDKDAEGIIYHTVKFCDYYHFRFKEMTEDKKMHVLKIETDLTPQSSGQLRTRFEAFAEALGTKATGSREENNMKYAAGIDIGSTSTDAVIMDDEMHILGSAAVPTGRGAATGAEAALKIALNQAGITKEELGKIVTTGYGRDNTGIKGSSVTEITCHAKGAHFMDPDARTIIDIGGQDSKAIKIDAEGNVVNFTMNDKCAAGTGRFLEMMARTLNMELGEMVKTGLAWKKDINISSMCTVFAESEVVSLIADNTSTADIIHGLNKAVAVKTAALARRIGGEEKYIMTGGVALNKGVADALSERLGSKVNIPPYPQLCGAIGAALIALGR